MLNIAPECPRCQSDEYYYKPRARYYGRIIIRERICRQCHQIFYTLERISGCNHPLVHSSVYGIRKQNGINIRYRHCTICDTRYKSEEIVVAHIVYNANSMHSILRGEPSITSLIKNLYGY